MSEAFQLWDRCNHGIVNNKKYMKSPDNFKENQCFHSSSNQKTKQTSHWKETQFNTKEGCSNKHSKHYVQFGNSCSQILKILLDQNSNLKQQNMYLQKQVNKLIGKEKELNQTVMQYQSVMSILNAQNIKLHQQILYFSDNANHKVDKLKSTISRYIKNNNRIPYQQNELEESNIYSIPPQISEEQEDPKYKRNRSEKAFGNFERLNKLNSKSPSMHFNNGNKYGCPFESLLDQCRREQDPQRRKEMRRRLIELTYNRSTAY